MRQAELNRAVAEATGESISTISSMGFVPLTDIPIEREPELVDWDEVDAGRNLYLYPRRRRTSVVY